MEDVMVDYGQMRRIGPQSNKPKRKAKRKPESRISYKELDDVCMDCGDYIKERFDCDTCAVHKLKIRVKEGK